MRLSDFEYHLPPELIAQEPVEQRDSSRLLVVRRSAGMLEHRSFADIVELVHPGDLLVMNDTRVTAARLRGHKRTGGKVEALLLCKLGANRYEAMVKPGRRVAVGSELFFGDGDLSAEVVERTESGGRILEFSSQTDCDTLIERIGEVPLPPYIYRSLADRERYQTIYARRGGSAAAPTAGLHFTPRLLEKIKRKGIGTTFVTLHIGLDTFRPVRCENVLDHEMHSETFSLSAEAAEAINSCAGRVVVVGTTTARALESAAVGRRRIKAATGSTSLFITPGYEFKIVDALVTNFHMPKSTLLMLVSALAGRDLILRAYAEAVKEQYRFLSFGDAMFIE
ncbi:MAG: tRNA preQ1(34) S-adenosylmethionine ribosyltransferase-isomerase QueA [Armatimonadota bacterium]|nr:tRNA preQ1(34) S-adenosylmethionine ribosyltransferase-isomerase QueA [Armatimonadota bacterium]